jgi:hypothetical protein
MSSTTVAVDDATEAAGGKVGITRIGSDRHSTSLASARIRGPDANSNHSNLVPANFRPVLSSDPELRRSFNRISVDRKFLSADGEPFFVRGVTYPRSGRTRPAANTPTIG